MPRPGCTPEPPHGQGSGLLLCEAQQQLDAAGLRARQHGQGLAAQTAPQPTDRWGPEELVGKDADVHRGQCTRCLRLILSSTGTT